MDKLLDLSMQELLDLKVVSAMKAPETINKVPATVRVITAEQIRANWYFTLEAPSLADMIISVNFTSRQFLEPDVVEFVEGALKTAGLEPCHLCIEITEGALIENTARTQSVMSRLQALEVKLFIDDFGTGYSSLSYLHHFPIHMLKIDRSFVSQMTSAGDPVPIVQTIISLGHTMGMQVLAEGVETDVQCSKLKALKCNSAQGFFFSRPVTAAETEAFLMSKRAWL